MTTHGILRDDESQEDIITLYVPGHPTPYTARTNHPNFQFLKAELADLKSQGYPRDEVEKIVEFFDPSKEVEKKFNSLSERVAVRNRRIYIDGDELHGLLARRVVQFIEESKDFGSLVNFIERLYSNPSKYAREQLFNYLDKHHYTITSQGMIVTYKSVASTSDPEVFHSIHSGPAIVDGVEVNGKVPYRAGSIVEMKRSMVEGNEKQGCAAGLHSGTLDYAQWFNSQGGNTILETHVNPRDVVSVPQDSNNQKIRSCRLKVIGVYTASTPHEDTVIEVDGTETDIDSPAVTEEVQVEEPVVPDPGYKKVSLWDRIFGI